MYCSCVLLPLHYLCKAMYISGHVYCYHDTTCTKPGKWAVMCIVTITLPVQSQDNEPSCVLLPLHYMYKARYNEPSCVLLPCTLPVQSQDNERSCVMLPLHYLYKARTMSDHMYCHHYNTCAKPWKQWVVMCIVTITLSCTKQVKWAVMCIVHAYCYHYTTCAKPGTISGDVYCYHYTTCTKPGKWAIICIVTITLPVQSQDNERSCVLLPLHYMYKAR